MNFEIIRTFINGMLIGILLTILIYKIHFDLKIRKTIKLIENQKDELEIIIENLLKGESEIEKIEIEIGEGEK